MSLKTKHLTIRITEAQFKNLADNLVIAQRTKSSLMRDLLVDYMDESKRGTAKKIQRQIKTKKH